MDLSQYKVNAVTGIPSIAVLAWNVHPDGNTLWLVGGMLGFAFAVWLGTRDYRAGY